MVRCQVRGPVAPLLKVLADAGVTELLSREPSLEELFLAQYGGTARQDEHGSTDAATAAGARARGPDLVGPGGSGAAGDRRRALTARKAVRSGVIWGYIFGIAIASSAISYTRIYKTHGPAGRAGGRLRLEQGDERPVRPGPQLQTVAGFTVFKISMTLMLLGAVWGLLTSTRLLRGEEDNGRWELLLAGPDHPRRRRRPGAGRPRRRRRHAVGGHRAHHRRSPAGTQASASRPGRRSTSPWPWWRPRSCSWRSAR